MKKLTHRILLALTFVFTASTVLPASAQSQAQTDSATGSMIFAMHTQFATALQAQGFTYAAIGTNNGTFPVVAGSLNETTGYGELICTGDLQYRNGALVMDLRNLHFENDATGESVTAAVYLNSAFQGRQVIFTSRFDEFWGLKSGLYQVPNSYISFDSTFKATFLSFFGTPQLANAFNADSVGFINFMLVLQPF